jgi:hypothetical protein
VTDRALADALFLVAHPSWSQRDLDETDQDIIDHLAVIDREAAANAREERLKAEREHAAAAHRSRLGGRRG